MAALKILLISEQKTVPVPVFRARIKCGFPSPALDYQQDAINLNELLIKTPSATFIIEAEGDSMAPVIPENALLIVDRSLKPQNDDIVLAVLDGEFTIKFYQSEKGQISLVPANKRFKPIPITDQMDFSIWGVIAKIISDPRKMHHVRNR